MATFTVTNAADSGAGSLRQAVLDANASDGRDVIVFDASFDGGAEDVVRLTSGQIEITDRLRIDGGPGVTITGDAAGDDVTNAAGITDVDASGAGRLNDNSRIFDASARLTLDGLTLTGGRAEGNGESGGAVRCTGARLTLIESTVSGNSTAGFNASGGGIYGHGSTIVLTNSTVHDNSIAIGYSSYGGGISSRYGSITLTNSFVTDNNNTFGPGGGLNGTDINVSNSTVSGNSAFGRGGGIDADDIMVDNSIVSGNTAERGGGIGGIYITVSNSTVRGNTATVYGGGISGMDITAIRSTINGNSAVTSGGGISAQHYPGGTATLLNTTVSGNRTTAEKYGGTGAGILADSLVAKSSTISGNKTVGPFASGAGIYISLDGDAHLTNTIVLGNRASNAGADEIFGPRILSGRNIVGTDIFSGMSGIGDTTARKVFDATVVIADGVRAGRLADNGGPTRTIALNPDAFNPAVGGASPGKAPARDQRGEARDAAPDLGAFEAGPVDGLVLLGSGGAERLTGGALDDQIYGRGGDDRLLGLAGDDQLRGELGHDRLRGGRGDDGLEGGAGGDHLRGDRGNDRLSGGAGNDSLRGDRGDDRLTGGAGFDLLLGLSGGDRLRGELGHDRLRGGRGDDTLDGQAGQDSLRGGRGSDQLSGGAGDDYLRGGRGDDRLSGEKGSDTFVFAGHFGHDAIDGFDARRAGGQDWIDLRAFEISPEGFEDRVAIEDLGEDTRVTVVVEGTGIYSDYSRTILCRDVSGDGGNRIDEADFLL